MEQPTRANAAIARHLFACANAQHRLQGVSDTAEDEGAVLWVYIAWHYGQWRCRSSPARRYSVDERFPILTERAILAG